MSVALDLDAIESAARDIAESPWLFADDLDDAREVARSALVLVAEVRQLRAQVPKRPPEQIARPSNAARGGAVVNIMFDPVPTRMVPVPVPSHRCPRCGYGR